MDWLKKHKLIVLIAAVIIVIVAAAGASNKPTINTTPIQSSSEENKGTPSQEPAKEAKVGDTISVKDQSNNKMDVTLVKILDNASGENEFSKPNGGNRFVAVQLSVKNTGNNVIEESSGNDTVAVDSKNQSYSSDYNSVSDCKSFAGGQIKLAPGETALGCVTFQLPVGEKLSKIKFTPSSGFSSSSASWLVP